MEDLEIVRAQVPHIEELLNLLNRDLELEDTEKVCEDLKGIVQAADQAFHTLRPGPFPFGTVNEKEPFDTWETVNDARMGLVETTTSQIEAHELAAAERSEIVRQAEELAKRYSTSERKFMITAMNDCDFSEYIFYVQVYLQGDYCGEGRYFISLDELKRYFREFHFGLDELQEIAMREEETGIPDAERLTSWNGDLCAYDKK